MLQHIALMSIFIFTVLHATVTTIIWDVDLVLVNHEYPAGKHEISVSEKMLSVVDHFRSKGIKTIAFSAMDKKTYDVLKRQKFFTHFDAVELCIFNKLNKTQPVAYTALMKRYKLAPQDVVFIDDREINLAAARAAGISNTYCFSLRERLTYGDLLPHHTCASGINAFLTKRCQWAAA